jgi:long-chain acyl-CoA synthetase
MSLNLATLLAEAARTAPAKPGIIINEPGNDVALPYHKIDELARKFATALRGLGIQPGQRVALMVPNVPKFTMAYYGAHYAGCPVALVATTLAAEDIAYRLEDSRAVALVVWEDFIEAARAGASRASGCRHLILCKPNPTDLSAPDGTTSYSAIANPAPPVADMAATGGDDTAVVVYDPGTAGRPPGVEVSHSDLVQQAEAMSPRLTMAPSGEARVLAVLPFDRSFGHAVLQNATLRAAGTQVHMSRFDALIAARQIQRHALTTFAGDPPMYQALLEHPEITPEMLGSLRSCLSVGAAMPAELVDAFKAKFHQEISEG